MNPTLKGTFGKKTRIVRKNIKRKCISILFLNANSPFWYDEFEHKQSLRIKRGFTSLIPWFLEISWPMKETGKHSQMQDTTAQMITTEQKCFKINAKLLDPKCLSKVSLPSGLNILSLMRMCLSILFKISLTHCLRAIFP